MRYNGPSPQEERARRRSFSDYPSPNASPGASHSSPHLHPPRPTAARRHSHPRRVSTDPDDSESDVDANPDLGRRSSGTYGSSGPYRSPKVVPRFVHIAAPTAGSPGGGSPAVPSASPAVPSSRSEGGAKLRPEGRISPIIPGARRKSGVEGAKDWAKEKISSIFPVASPSERPPRKSPGSSSGNIPGTGGGGSRDSLRLGRSRSYDDGNSDTDSEYERERRRRRRARERERRERDAAYERDRERERASRRSRDDLPEWDQDPRSRSRRDREGLGGGTRYSRRPDNPRRTSSHADVDRLERERMHHYEYADERRRRGAEGLEERGPRDRTASPVIKGVRGRRYPAPVDSPPL